MIEMVFLNQHTVYSKEIEGIIILNRRHEYRPPSPILTKRREYKSFKIKYIILQKDCLCFSGLLVAFLYFRTTAKHDINKITRTKGLLSYILQFIGMLAYRFFR